MRFGSVLSMATFMVAIALTGYQQGEANPSSATAAFPFYTYLQNPESALVAFNPTNYDPRPGNHRKIPPTESLQADLAALHPAFDGLILYAYDEDVTPRLLEEAVRQEYRAVLLGVWDIRSEEELDGTAALVKQFHNTLALAVCLGNEGIQFQRYTFGDLMSAREQFRKRLNPDISVPICTSEPFGQYEQKNLQEFGDFLAPNIHPVFDRPDLDPIEAAEWARERATALTETARTPLLVKETGFPHGGDDRFTPETQRAFWAAYTDRARYVRVSPSPHIWISYAAAFEAVDLPWKAELTNMPIEAAWGLLSTSREPFPAFSVWKDLRRRSQNYKELSHEQSSE